MSGNLSDLDFDAIDENAGGGNFEPLPAGQYMVAINTAEVKENRSGTGSYLALAFDVIDGPHTGRKLWENLTVHHDNETAQNIGRGRIKKLCRSLGLKGVADSAELAGMQLMLRLNVARKKDGSGMENRVAAYEAVAPAQPPAKTPAKPTGAPWGKK